MTHLIIYAHPNPNSFNHAILEEVIKASGDHHVIVRDLYQLNFNPILEWQEFRNTIQHQYAEDIAEEHRYFQQAEVITLIYPLWWMGFPAILKGYLDRVIAYGFAYKDGTEKSIGLLGDKRVQQFVTLGNAVEEYRQKGYLQAFEHTLGYGLFNFCGIEKVDMHYFGEVGLSTTDYQGILNKIKHITQEIFLS
ncbi:MULTISPECIES: NAD(P)H-dependent oxidoreductase [Glaesserella]|uniref:NAD(P)H oxidoreductase n=1 Tax=Glaesserella australis TaxID=2094024 RepID=A0A328C0U6_9PAST|nr:MULTISPECIES: NAD(P)H-dependent oxidoreductase [Glaesserella]AUI66566.1 NAD(P)H oxidoreductase [Glaesserella sp. 15-184]RAL18740.1 NAD(P)H oxidoreductase [Glaesserella australis]